MGFDFASIVEAMLLTMFFYIVPPLIICSFIKAIWKKRPYKTVIAFNIVAVLILVFALRYQIGDSSPHNAAPAFIWSLLAYYIIIKILGKPAANKDVQDNSKDFTPIETTIPLENVNENNEKPAQNPSPIYKILCLILGSLLIASIFYNAYQFDNYNAKSKVFEDTIVSLRQGLDSESAEVSRLQISVANEQSKILSRELKISHLENIVDFYFEYACVVTNKDKYFHRLGCQIVSSADVSTIKDVAIYDKFRAEDRGYSPCPLCQTDTWSVEKKNDY